MNDEERRQHEVDKLIHNKIAKEFQMKARMKAKMRRLHKQESLSGGIGYTAKSLGSMLNISLDIPDLDYPAAPLSLQRSNSELSTNSLSFESSQLFSNHNFEEVSAVDTVLELSQQIPLKRTVSDVLRDVCITFVVFLIEGYAHNLLLSV
jgi:hypothetical protein